MHVAKKYRAPRPMDAEEKLFTAATSIAGPTPKLTRSAAVSKYLPKLLVTPSFLAAAPSIKSKAIATKINNTPNPILLLKAHQTAPVPAARLPRVRIWGRTTRMLFFTFGGKTRIPTEIVANTTANQIRKLPTLLIQGV